MVRRVIRIIVFISILFQIQVVYAENKLNRIDIDASILSNGNLEIEENWNVNVDTNSELNKGLIGLDGSEISGLSVMNETGEIYTMRQPWDSTKSRLEKYTAYGYTENIAGDISIFWGIGDYGQRAYTLNYTLSDIIRSSKDSKYTKLTLISPTDNLKADLLTLKLHFDDVIDVDKLDIHIYGADYNLIKDKNTLDIECSSIEYLVMLIGYNDYYTNLATKFKTDYSYNDLVLGLNDGNGLQVIKDVLSIKDIIIVVGISLIVIILIVIIIKYLLILKRVRDSLNVSIRFINTNEHNGTTVNKVDIPDIYTTYVVGLQYKIIESKYSIIGVLLLELLQDKYIDIRSNDDYIEIQLIQEPNKQEHFKYRLYKILYDINNGDIINLRLIERYLRYNSNSLESLIDDINNSIARGLQDKALIERVKVGALEHRLIHYTEYKVKRGLNDIVSIILGYRGNNLEYRYILGQTTINDNKYIDNIQKIVNLISLRVR